VFLFGFLRVFFWVFRRKLVVQPCPRFGISGKVFSSSAYSKVFFVSLAFCLKRLGNLTSKEVDLFTRVSQHKSTVYCPHKSY